MASANKPLEDTHERMGEVENEIGKDEDQEHNQLKRTNKVGDTRRRKIFVGGLPSGISQEEFKNYFEKFGTITDVVVMQDSVTRKPKGFGFITFDSEKSIGDALVNKFCDLNGKQVDVKKVVPKEEYPELRCRNGIRTYSHSSTHQGPRCITPHGGASLISYNNNALYLPASKTYHGWHPINGYGGNGYAFPYDPYTNIYYVPMVPIAQPYWNPYANFSPRLTYMSGTVGQRMTYSQEMGSNMMCGLYFV